jgi:hypothetical protein
LFSGSGDLRPAPVDLGTPTAGQDRARVAEGRGGGVVITPTEVGVDPVGGVRRVHSRGTVGTDGAHCGGVEITRRTTAVDVAGVLVGVATEGHRHGRLGCRRGDAREGAQGVHTVLPFPCAGEGLREAEAVLVARVIDVTGEQELGSIVHAVTVLVRAAFVDVAIAIAVHAVAVVGLGGRAQVEVELDTVRINGRVGVVAVLVIDHVARGLRARAQGATGITEAVGVRVLIPLARGTGRVGVVAVGVVAHVARGGIALGRGARRRVTVAIGVCVRIPVRVGADVDTRVVVVDVPVAVVVHAVADLRRNGIDVDIVVVAVCGVAHVARRLATRIHGARTVTVAISVGVGVEGRVGTRVHAGVVIVDVAIAVVVHAVADFARRRTDGTVTIIAVPVGRHVARGGIAVQPVGTGAVAVGVPIRVERGLRARVGARIRIIRHAVAVLVGVRAVTDLGRVGADGRVAVVAVISVVGVAAGLTAARGRRRRSVAVSIAVRVLPPLDRIGRIGLVRGAIAVVVCPVTQLRRRRVDVPVGVVAVRCVRDVAGRADISIRTPTGIRGVRALGQRGTRGVAVAVLVEIRVPVRTRLIVADVAVVVDAVTAHLDFTGVDAGVGVVAVVGVPAVAGGLLTGRGGLSHLTVGVTIGIRPIGSVGCRVDTAVVVIAVAVAVLVDIRVVTDLIRIGMDVRIRIVAVGVRGDVALRGFTAGGHEVLVTEAVLVGIQEELLSTTRIWIVVHVAVAVVVDLIALLGCVRVGQRIIVVTVVRRRHVLIRLLAGHGDVHRIAVAIAIGIRVELPHDTLVDITVAVVVLAVADLLTIGVPRGVSIVTVPLVLGVAIAITVTVGIIDTGLRATAVGVLAPSLSGVPHQTGVTLELVDLREAPGEKGCRKHHRHHAESARRKCREQNAHGNHSWKAQAKGFRINH